LLEFQQTGRLRRRNEEGGVKNILYVQIMGREYPVEANPGDELYVNRLAQYVEEKMRETKEDSHVVDSYKLAVMAAMNITDELFRLQESKGSSSRSFESQADEWIKMLDQALAHSASK
jgi:cell division protein ZapA